MLCDPARRHGLSAQEMKDIPTYGVGQGSKRVAHCFVFRQIPNDITSRELFDGYTERYYVLALGWMKEVVMTSERKLPIASSAIDVPPRPKKDNPSFASATCVEECVKAQPKSGAVDYVRSMSL
jgi:hypothetical protein